MEIFASITFPMHVRFQTFNAELSDRDSGTCIEKSEVITAGHELLGTIKISDETFLSRGNVTIEFKGGFSSCYSQEIVFTIVQGPVCPRLQACVPDKVKNQATSTTGVCYVNCDCSEMPCNIMILIFYAHVDNFFSVCEVDLVL